MIRQTLCAILFFALLGSVLDQVSHAQPAGSSDNIYYRRDGAIKRVDGQLKEASPGVYQVMSFNKAVTEGKSTLELTAAEIVRVVPGADLPGLARDKLTSLDGIENGKDYATAKPKYDEVLKTPGGLKQPTKRYVETRSNLLRARLLEEADEETRKGESQQLISDLTGYLDSYPKGWETWPIGRALARIHADGGRYAESAKTWSRLAKSDGLAKDLRDDAALREIDAMIRDGKFDEAAARAADLAKSAPATASAKDRLEIYLAASKGSGNVSSSAKEIEAVIAKTKDPLARAAGYSMLGELYLAAKQYREAMWAYLWVEVVFNQDRDEVLNAMARLSTVFDALGEKERAESYKERIRKYRSES